MPDIDFWTIYKDRNNKSSSAVSVHFTNDVAANVDGVFPMMTYVKRVRRTASCIRIT